MSKYMAKIEEIGTFVLKRVGDKFEPIADFENGDLGYDVARILNNETAQLHTEISTLQAALAAQSETIARQQQELAIAAAMLAEAQESRQLTHNELMNTRRALQKIADRVPIYNVETGISANILGDILAIAVKALPSSEEGESAE